MISYTHGDLLQAKVDVLVNPVNCVGVMGRGLALAFRAAYPANFTAYKEACTRGALQPGILLTFDRIPPHSPRYIINFPTKIHWRGTSRMEYIEQGLTALTAEVQRLEIRSLALPPLGCGLGGLRWADVKPRIESAFAVLSEVRVLIYEPADALVSPPPSH